MHHQIMIFIGLFSLMINVWLTAGEDNDVINTTMTINKEINDSFSTTGSSITEESNVLEDPKTLPQAFDLLEENVPDIDRSSYFVPQDYHRHHYHGPSYHGFWKKKFIWRPRWVKTWQEKKVYVAVWKRMWGPASINEWVPVPKPPPGWIKPSVHGLGIKTIPY